MQQRTVDGFNIKWKSGTFNPNILPKLLVPFLAIFFGFGAC